jgi:adenylate cyclase
VVIKPESRLSAGAIRREKSMNSKSDDLWYWYLTGEKRENFPKEYERVFNAHQRIYRLFPGKPRCLECDIPLAGPASFVLRPWGSRPSSFSPRICSTCEVLAKSEEAGAEVETTLLFADIRDSTPLAERMGISGFKEVIRRFYKATSQVLIEHYALVNRLMGDQVSAVFVPRFSGKNHAIMAIQAAQDLLRVTGHADPNGPWIPVGVGVHTGLAYVGAVGSKDGVKEIAVLGSAANLTARLSSQAKSGEILVSEDAAKSAELDISSFEKRVLDLKGISQSVPVSVIQIKSQSPS